MKFDKTDTLIRKAIFDLLKEQTEDKKEKPEDKKEKPEKKQKTSSSKNSGVISTSGAFGSGGRAKSFVASAKSRANEDPEGLLKDLGIRAAAGGDDLQSAQQILSTAIYSNAIMGEAYAGASITKDIVPRFKENETISVVAVDVAGLDRKNGIRFLAHTLIAAQNAGFLSLTGGLQFGKGQSNSIVIYSI